MDAAGTVLSCILRSTMRSGAGPCFVEQSVPGLLSSDAQSGGLEHANRILHTRLRIMWRTQMRNVVIDGLADHVDVVRVAPSGHADVEMFAVQSWSSEQDPDVGGRSLGAIDGRCPAVVGMGGEVVTRECCASSAVEVFDDQPTAGAGGDDRRRRTRAAVLPTVHRRAAARRVRRARPAPLRPPGQGRRLPPGEVARRLRLRRQPRHQPRHHQHARDVRVGEGRPSAVSDRDSGTGKSHLPSRSAPPPPRPATG